MTALVIRKDRTPAVLRKLAKAEANPRAARRLLAIANALSGMSRKEAAEAAGMEEGSKRLSPGKPSQEEAFYLPWPAHAGP